MRTYVRGSTIAENESKPSNQLDEPHQPHEPHQSAEPDKPSSLLSLMTETDCVLVLDREPNTNTQETRKLSI